MATGARRAALGLVLAACAGAGCTLLVSADGLSNDQGGRGDDDAAAPAQVDSGAGPPDGASHTCEAGPCGLDAGAVAPSCKALLAAAPGTPSGTYRIDPDGDGADAPFEVYCDMTLAGGGFTQVYLAGENEASTSLDYTSASAALLAAAGEAALAFRASSLAVVGSTAVFALPATWRAAAPFRARASEELVMVTVDDAAGAPRLLRYGSANFNTQCADPWIPNEDYGRICVVGTSAPFFSGWSHGDRDYCVRSSENYKTLACESSGRRFSIAVR